MIERMENQGNLFVLNNPKSVVRNGAKTLSNSSDPEILLTPGNKMYGTQEFRFQKWNAMASATRGYNTAAVPLLRDHYPSTVYQLHALSPTLGATNPLHSSRIDPL